MGNKEITCKHKTKVSECPFGCQDLGQNQASPAKKPVQTASMPKQPSEAKTGGISGLAKSADNTAEIQQTVKKIPRGKPFLKTSENNGVIDPRIRTVKPKGEVSYATVFFQALRTMRDSKGRKITKHDIVRAGIMPMLDHIAKGDARFHPHYDKVMDRIFGRPVQGIDHTTKGDKLPQPVQIIGMRFVKDEATEIN